MKEFMKKCINMIEAELERTVQKLSTPERLKEAMLYSLQAGGKRLRPVLLMATLKAFNKEEKMGLSAACALEMIHTYSLIHDDLPSMDDDDLRRGKPTNHKVFGEAFAILAGDGLLTYSFQMIAEDESISPQTRMKLIALLAKCAGPEGMVGGQAADIEGENQSLSLEQLEYIHLHKTGKLLVFSVLAGAIIAGANEEELKQYERYAVNLGLAFQIQDDILDIEGDESKIGKPVGSDADNHKSTYPSLLSLDGAKSKLAEHVSMAKGALENAGHEAEFLFGITDLVAQRDH
ncbi:polyprenyl synthetase family protein [Falsibacillus pallidus]|uniref:polyprenyl synthetase family protein n=1 Tax=Falsibacillus pallidus TaxID=493781 RepID=UPI003D999429